jgi:NADH-quinone oxidoreductase subunit C
MRRAGVLPDSIPESAELKLLSERFPDAVTDAKFVLGELTLLINPQQLIPFCSALRREHAFERLSSVTGVDSWPIQPRFEVVYHLHSIKNNSRLRLKVSVGEGEEIESVTPIWKTANWYEREVYDLFGIKFKNHPNLERIMMPVDWEGHPLRKDYPVHGYKYSYGEHT